MGLLDVLMGSQPADPTDFQGQGANIATQLAQIAALRKTQMPTGDMVSGHYVAPTKLGMLTPLLSNLTADVEQKQVNQKQQALNAAEQQDLMNWVNKRPQGVTSYGAGDEGPTMTTTPPTDQDMVQWAAQGAGSQNPLTKTLANASLNDTVVNQQARNDKYQDRADARAATNQRAADDRQARADALAQNLDFKNRQLEVQMADKSLSREQQAMLQRQHDDNALQIQQLRGQQALQRVQAQNGMGPGGDGDGPLDPATAKLEASKYWANGGKFDGSYGTGARATAMKNQVMRLASQMYGSGDPAADAQDLARNKAAAGSFNQNAKQEGQMMAYLDTLHSNVQGLRDAMTKVDNSGVPIYNRIANATAQQLTNDPDLAAANYWLQTVQGEAAKINSGSLGNTPTSDSLRKEFGTLLSTSMTPESIDRVLNVINQEGENRRAGFEAQRKRAQSSLFPQTRAAQNPAAAPAAASSGSQRYVDPQAGKGGRIDVINQEWSKPQTAVDQEGLAREARALGVTLDPAKRGPTVNQGPSQVPGSGAVSGGDISSAMPSAAPASGGWSIKRLN